MRLTILPLLLIYGISIGQVCSITNVMNRESLSLNGDWNIIIDPYENGFFNYRHEENPNGFGQNQKQASPTDLIEYDFDKSPTLKVPGDWNSQLNELKYYEGAIWYKKSFDYQLTQGKRLFVNFGAANHVAYVYLNGKKLGRHEGGFTPFYFEITDHVKDRNNHLVVMVENKRQKERIPTTNTDWWNYGGITRDVSLIESGQDFLLNYSITATSLSEIRIQATIDSKAQGQGTKLEVSIPELSFKKSLKASKEGNIDQTYKLEFTPWSAQSPKLYEVNLDLSDERIKDQIGFKTIKTRGTNIEFNGQNIFLKGICLHEEFPWEARRAHSKSDAIKMLSAAKDLGCNYVRLAHYPHNENMLRAADSLGLMVWAEVPVYWTIDWTNEKTLQNAKDQISEMVTRDINRASIIIWSVGNETPVRPERNVFMKSLVDHVHTLDTSRPVSAALEVEWGDPIRLDDPLGEHLDILGCNEYIGWYGGKPEDCLAKRWESKWNKPLVITEFGAGAKHGNNGSSDAKWTEEYQARVYRNQIDMMEKIDFLVGMSPWVLFDFRSPRRQLPAIQDWYNRKGLLSEKGEKKQSFTVLQQYYSKK